jgi:2-polyprenyl-6-methoxyphenol hydroxylase-like FAD-dependent oxidoreductase
LRQLRVWGLAADVALHVIGWDVTMLERAAELAEVGPLQDVAGLPLLADAAGRLAD